MKINFISRFNYENMFKSLKVSQTVKKQWSFYKFFDETDKFVGKFEFADEGKFYFENYGSHVGYITGLEIPKWLRGKKEAINVLLNIKKLVLEEATKKKMDIVHFAAGNDNPNNVAKLYKRLFPEAVYKFSDGYTRFAVPIKENSKKQAQQILNDFEMIYRNSILDNEVEIPPIATLGIDFL